MAAAGCRLVVWLAKMEAWMIKLLKAREEGPQVKDEL